MSLQHTEAEKVERLRASPPSGGSVAGGEPPELDQPGLALVKRQAELLQPVLEVREELLPIRLELAAEDHIVRIPADDHLPGCPTSSPLADPEVDDVVEEYIGKDRADPRPLRRACLHRFPLAALEDAGLQPSGLILEGQRQARLHLKSNPPVVPPMGSSSPWPRVAPGQAREAVGEGRGAASVVFTYKCASSPFSRRYPGRPDASTGIFTAGRVN